MARYVPGYIATAEDGALLDFKSRPGSRWELTYTPAPDALALAEQLDKDFAYPKKAIRLAKGHRGSASATIYPHIFDANSPNFLHPRYNRLRTISLKGFGASDIVDLGSLEEFFENLPAGFIRSPYRGLGLNFDIRLIIETIEKLQIDDLRIEKGLRGAATLEDESFVMPFALFETARKEIGRVHAKALTAARVEKGTRLQDKLLNPIDSETYPIIGAPYHPDAIVKAVGNGVDQGLTLSKADTELIVTTAAGLIKDVGERDPSQLLKISEKIETVTLKALVAHMRTRIDANHSEDNWQKFLTNNAFILRIAFGVPVLMFQGQATVGGRSYNGAGDKRTDFLLQAVSSGNLSIVEIKRPQTKLLTPHVYRGGIHGPHGDLSGAVAQALDQRWQLQQNNRALADDLRRQRGAIGEPDVPPPEAYAVQCLVIIGRSPSVPNEQKSFELYRNGLDGVTVITFDELLIKLETLLRLLQDPDATTFVVPTVTMKKLAQRNRRRGKRHIPTRKRKSQS